MSKWLKVKSYEGEDIIIDTTDVKEFKEEGVNKVKIIYKDLRHTMIQATISELWKELHCDT